jgi:hypothetical protein
MSLEWDYDPNNNQTFKPMKILYKSLLMMSAVGVLSTSSLFAQSTVVLDGFESGFATNSVGTTNVAVFTTYGGRSASGEVVIAPYTATGPGDSNVSEGTHSIGITFYAQGFGNDFMVTLSDAASAAVEAAVSSNQVARYILRYDMIFSNPSQYTYFNQHAFVGADWNYLQLGGANANGLATFSCALDLPTLWLPGSGPISFLVANDFGTTQSPFTNCTIYIDNIRLVDTYGAGATPVIYPLQSFENGAAPLGGATNLSPTVATFGGNPVTTRATLSQYGLNGLYNASTNPVPGIFTLGGTAADTDFGVSDGTHALQVNNATPAGFQADFAIPFAGTKLASVLKLGSPPAQRPTQAQLARYTLRWDATMPAVSNDGDYANMVYNTGSSWLPMAQGRRQYGGQTGLQRLTYSVTLDQIASWGGSPTGGDPSMVFLFDGANEGGGFNYYYDNFVLIETAPTPLVITASQYNPGTHQFTLTWDSTDAATYSVLSSATVNGTYTALAAGIASAGSQTSTTVVVPNGNVRFLRIQQQ